MLNTAIQRILVIRPLQFAKKAVKLTVVALASWAYFALSAGSVDLDPVLSSNVALTLGSGTERFRKVQMKDFMGWNGS